MEILGLLDTLESMIMDGSRIPFTKKLIVNEDKILAVVDKIRLVVQGGGGFAKEAITGKPIPAEKAQAEAEAPRQSSGQAQVHASPPEGGEAVEVLQQAYQMAKEIREGADHYADEVLENLEATSSRILRTVKAGRDRLAKTAPVEEKK
ncbi:MAG: hypothetical protein U9R38_08450 [Candidatus Margulisiibacteriota bacterium]|nr:hypothetical protein [Candidatus Margulisiibacteriota bacterium]